MASLPDESKKAQIKQGGINYHSISLLYIDEADHTQDGRIDISAKGV